MTINVRAKPVTFLHEINHCCTVISHSYCLKTTHKVKCRTDAVNNLSRSLENYFIEANIYKISESVIPHHTLFQHQLGYLQHLTSKSSGVTDGGQRRAASPGHLNLKSGPLLADILTLVFFCFSVVFLRFSVCFVFLPSIDFQDFRIHYHFLTFFRSVG